MAWSAFQPLAACSGERLNWKPRLGTQGGHFTSQVSTFSSINPQRIDKTRSFYTLFGIPWGMQMTFECHMESERKET